MEENKFFRYVWRINGLILMITGLLAIGVLVFAGYKIYTETSRERNTRNIVNVQEETQIKEIWKLGYSALRIAVAGLSIETITTA